MERWRMFNDMVKAMKFVMWCGDNGIKVTGQKLYGTGVVEVNYIADARQNAMIPEQFKRV